jgi:hypothetical protein
MSHVALRDPVVIAGPHSGACRSILSYPLAQLRRPPACVHIETRVSYPTPVAQERTTDPRG